MKTKIIFAVLLAALVGLGVFSAVQTAQVGKQDDRADIAESRLASTRSDLKATRSDLATAERDRDDAQSQLAEIEEAKTSGLHDAAYLARRMKAKYNSEWKKDDLSVRIDDISCVSENQTNTRFVCLIEQNDGDKWNAKVSVSEEGDQWIARQEGL